MNYSKIRRFFPLVSFLLPVLCLCSYFMWKGIAPFGNNTFLIHDMNAQYIDYFAYFRTVLLGENDFRYSLSRCLGGPFPAFFFYYLICPFNFIPLLFPDVLMPVGVTLEMLLIFGFAGLSCFCCLRKIVPDISLKFLLYLSTAYSVSAWMLLNAENFQFTQEAIILPVLICSLDRLKKQNKLLASVLLLAFALILNFYIGAMIWLFSALWLFIPDNDRFNWRYIVVFLFALALSSPVWITVLSQMGSTIKQTDPLWYEPGFNFSLIDLFKKFLPGQFDVEQFQDAGLPAVYCGLLTLFGAAVFFFCGEYSQRKQHHLIMLIIMYVSLIFHPLTMIWHGLSQPHWWPYRFSFLFIFLIILCAAESRLRIPSLLLIPFFAGLLFNLDRTFSVKLMGAVPFDAYAEAIQEKHNAINSLPGNKNELYRIGDIYPRSDNDAMHFSYNGITGFDSLADRRIMDFLTKSGFPKERYTVRYGLGNTFFANELLGVRYIFGPDNSMRERINSGLAFWIGSEIPVFLPEETEPVDFQNDLARSLGMETPFLQHLESAETALVNLECNDEFCWKQDIYNDGVVRYTMKVPDTGILYALPESPVQIGEMAFHIESDSISLSDPDSFLPLTMVLQSGDLSVDLVTSDPLMELPRINFVLEDKKAVLDFFTEHRDGILAEKIKSSQLRITFPQTMATEWLAIMIPYDSHWQITGNKEDLRIKPLWGTFLAAEIPVGTSEIILCYR